MWKRTNIVLSLLGSVTICYIGFFLSESVFDGDVEILAHINDLMTNNTSLENKPKTSGNVKKVVRYNNDTRPIIAICYSGHIRSFHDPLLRTNHLVRIFQPLESLGYRVELYMRYGRGHCARNHKCHDSDISDLDKYDSKMIEDWWSQKGYVTHDSIFDKEKDVWSPSGVYNFTIKKCGKYQKQHVGILNQFSRLRRCFEDIMDDEEKTGRKVDIVARLRPDLYYLKGLDIEWFQKHVMKSTETAVFLPRRFLAGNGGGLNDWASLCRREYCEEYLLSERKFERCEDARPPFPAEKYCCAIFDPQDMRVVMTHTKVYETWEIFPVTVARTSNHPLVEGAYRITNSSNKTVLACGRLARARKAQKICLEDQITLFDAIEGGPHNINGSRRTY